MRAMDPNAFKGERVLGIGGGPTSVWAMEHAVHGEAAHVEVAGQMPRPKKGTALGDDLIQVEAQIRAHVDANEPVPAELTNRHHEIVTEHVLERRGRVAELDAQLAAGTLTGHPLELAQQERARIASELDPFLGSRVDRNEKMLNSDKITFAVADVIQVKPIKDAAGNNVIMRGAPCFLTRALISRASAFASSDHRVLSTRCWRRRSCFSISSARGSFFAFQSAARASRAAREPGAAITRSYALIIGSKAGA